MSNPLQKAAEILKIKKEYLEILSTPQRIAQVNFPVKMDSGEVKIFSGYRVQHNNARGPYKGGIRYHQSCDLEEVSDLAFWMSMKCAVVNIPYGGGKGGVVVNPKELSAKELQRLTRAYTRAIADVIGPFKDVPAPDVYTGPREMAWIFDEYSKIVGKKTPAVVTGKPLAIGGSLGRDIATALGGVYVLEQIIKNLKWRDKKLSVAIQGFGNAGSNAAKLLAERGFIIIAVADSKSAIIADDPEAGLNIKALLKFKQKTGSVVNFPATKEISQKELVLAPADILIPAALGGLITPDDAKEIKAKMVLELANGPLKEGAEEILIKKDVLVVPDILANAGGVTVSYFEWLQNVTKKKWSEQRVFEELKKTMDKAAKEVWQISRKHKTDIRTAAYVSAVGRIAKAIRIK